MDERVKYYARSFGGTVFVIEAGEIFYSLPKREEGGKTFRGWVLKEGLLGGRVKGVKGQEEASARVSYFIGNDASRWRSNISTYGSVSFGEAYEGIEVKLKTYGRSVEKLFYVRAGVEPGVIRLRLSGAESLEVNGEGELEVRTGLGGVKFSRPAAYQEVEGERRYVEVSYQVEGNNYGFKLGDYDRGRELVIDPLLQSTYLGGSDYDPAHSIAIGSGGNVYVAGYTDSTDFPGTTGGAQPSYGGGYYDAFVAKLNPTLTSIVQSTYLGGSDYDHAFSIAIDSGGNVYVAGYTDSTDFPGTTGGAQPSYGGGLYDAFVARLNPTLTALLQSTYLGGSGEDWINSIAIDSGGNIYVAGEALSTDFPATTGGAQSSNSGSGDAFVTKLNPTLTGIVQSTYLGGSDYDHAYSIAIDSGGSVYVAGETWSTDFPGTTGGAQTSNGGGPTDAFVTKLNPTLTTILQSTYLGGSFYDRASSIATDSAGNIYMAGGTASTDFPGTEGGAQPSNGGVWDAFVTKLNPTLTTILQSTYLGGSGDEGAASIAIDSGGCVYVAGETWSTDFPGTTGGAQPSNGGGYDAFVAKFDSSLAATPPHAPVVTSFKINSGAASTAKGTVTLNNVATNSPTHYIASEDPNFDGASWQPYSTAPAFTLSTRSGTKMVYFKAKNNFGESARVSDTILALAPAVTLFKINSGALNTAKAAVTLNNTATNSPTHYMASEDPGFLGGVWQAYSTAPSFALSRNSGTRTVYFKIKNAFDESAVMSDTIFALGPAVSSFKINSGALSTAKVTVTLNNVATKNPTHFMASESLSFDKASWQPYSTAPKFTLIDGGGEKTVYFKVKNSLAESPPASDTISALAPTVTSININNGAISTALSKVTLNWD